MIEYVDVGSLKVALPLHKFIVEQALPGTDIPPSQFWQDFEQLIASFSPRIRDAVANREYIQAQIDAWHKNPAHSPIEQKDYIQFLRDIGYIEPEGEPFEIETEAVDPELATVAGPQLVVPVSNPRFALNAANARWGSLFDALYGSDVIDESQGCERGGSYNPKRGERVVAYACEFLDRAVPLSVLSHREVCEYKLEAVAGRRRLLALSATGEVDGLLDPSQFSGFVEGASLSRILLCNNGLHIELQIDREHPVGQSTMSGLKDVLLEAAITTIQDCEDSVSAVDAEDKVAVYRNWLGLMQGTLTATFNRNRRTETRALNGDREYTGPDGTALVLKGRSLLFVRNVGHLMTSSAVLGPDGAEVSEGLVDAMVTVLCALHDLRGNSIHKNSATGSVYIVKPKMHGSVEVALCDAIFTGVEKALGLLPNTVKVGVMDEERRTSVNLRECIRAVKSRLVFINTGFLDRTGDEIATSMEAGPVLPKADMKHSAWLRAYEDRNVDIGLECGLPGRAQIGKGMWAKPDEMRQMIAQKQAHPDAGGSCAWVPSPTAAVLHAMHYHHVDVFARQRELRGREFATIEDLLTPPLLGDRRLTRTEIMSELENNLQGVLGYVVRWVGQGVGCSKVPDIDNVAFMEDRATLRISSQHVANWLHHGICIRDEVMQVMRRMAMLVDEQNANDPEYVPMGPHPEASLAFKAACELVFEARKQPNGYTEPVLHYYRVQAKRDTLGT